MLLLGHWGLTACSSAGGRDESGGENDGLASGGQTASGGVSTFDGAGGTSALSGGASGDGGAGVGATSAGGNFPEGGGGIGGTGSGGTEPSSGGESGTGGETSAGGESSTGGANPGVGGSDAMDGCPHSGNVTYELNGSEAWPAEVVTNITEAMDEAAYYYNCYADLEKHVTVNYNPGVPTAEANVDGWLSFGSNLAYMQTATAMHEVAHTLGVGYYPWAELIQEGRWVGPTVDALMNSLPAEERDSDMYSQRTYITCDSQHFWPYGLNQAAEYQTEWSVINHVRIVAAMSEDKAAYLSQ